MKTFAKVCVALVLSLFVLTGFTGCAARQAQTLDANYAAYVAALQAYANKEHKPMLDLELDEEGKVKGLKVWKEPPPLNIQQVKDSAPHPGWKVLNSLVRVGGVVGGIWAAGDAMEGIISAIPAGGNNYTFGSNNGGDGSATLTDSMNSATFSGNITGDTQLWPSDRSTTDNSDHSDQSDNSATDDNSNNNDNSTTTN